MPSRNIYKLNVPEAYYHAYARGASKLPIFNEPTDYHYFVSLFARYLSLQPVKNKAGLAYPHFRGHIELLCYCLMGNHFHLLLYQVEVGEMAKFMRCLMNSYTRYFNFKYKRSGPLFESRYKAAMINDEQYLQHISRYIHLNPRYWKRYPYSSIQGYDSNNLREEWLQPEKIIQLFPNKTEYLQFLADYEDQKLRSKDIKHLLADR